MACTKGRVRIGERLGSAAQSMHNGTHDGVLPGLRNRRGAKRPADRVVDGPDAVMGIAERLLA